jgi:hypothetical protein
VAVPLGPNASTGSPGAAEPHLAARPYVPIGSNVAPGTAATTGSDVPAGSTAATGSDVPAGSTAATGSDVFTRPAASRPDVSTGADMSAGADVPSGADVAAGPDGATAQGTDAQAEADLAADHAGGPDAADSARLADDDHQADDDDLAADDKMATPSGRPADRSSAGHVGSAGDANRRDDHAVPASTHERGGDAAAEPAEQPEGEQPEKASAISASMDVTVVPGVARYHRSECILIRFLGPDDLDIMTRQAAEADGCVPCRACQPDKLPADA